MKNNKVTKEMKEKGRPPTPRLAARKSGRMRRKKPFLAAGGGGGAEAAAEEDLDEEAAMRFGERGGRGEEVLGSRKPASTSF